MLRLGNAASVGLAVIVAAVLFGGMFAFFNGGGFFKHTYTLDVLFDNVDGITPSVPVELAGVEIGTVRKVSLTAGRKADLTLEIKDKINGAPVRIPTGSQFTISSAILGGSGVVMIVPPANAQKHPNDTIALGATDLEGTRTGDITTSLAHANDLIDQLTLTTRRIDVLVADPALQRSLKQTAANLNTASANGARLTDQLNRTVVGDNKQALELLQQDNRQAMTLLHQDNAEVQQLLSQTRVSSRVALNNLTDTTATIKGTTMENREKINQIVSNLNDTTAAVAGITQQTNDLLSKGGITQNLSATVANLKTATDKLNTIAGSLQGLTTDPTLQSNLKQTVANIKDSSEETKLLLQRLNKLAGTKRPAAVVIGPGGAVVVPPVTTGGGGTTQLPHSNETVPLILPRVDLVQNTRSDHFRVDLDTIVPLPSSPTAFARAGIYGLGDTNKLTLQYGSFGSRGSFYDYRYGLYASKLAVGADFGLGRPESFSFDLYDPNRVHLDAHGVLMLAPELGLLAGGEDLTRHGGLIVGLEYRSAK